MTSKKSNSPFVGPLDVNPVGKTKGRQDLKPSEFNPTNPHVQQEVRTERNNPQGAGPGHRGDRRDMNKAYTNNRRTQANNTTNPKSGRGHSTGK